MKKSILLGTTLALVGLAIVSTNAQTQTTTSTSYIQSSTVVGSKIKDSRGEEVGVIKDFVLDRNSGCLAYVVVSTGKGGVLDRKSTRLNSSHDQISYAVFCLKKKKKNNNE